MCSLPEFSFKTVVLLPGPAFKPASCYDYHILLNSTEKTRLFNQRKTQSVFPVFSVYGTLFGPMLFFCGKRRRGGAVPLPDHVKHTSA